MIIQLKIEMMITQLITKNLIHSTTLAIALKDDIGEQNKLFAKMPEKMGKVWRGRHYRASKSGSTLCPIFSCGPASVYLPNICFAISV